MKKLIFSSMLIMTLVFFTSCNFNSGLTSNFGNGDSTLDNDNGEFTSKSDNVEGGTTEGSNDDASANRDESSGEDSAENKNDVVFDNEGINIDSSKPTLDENDGLNNESEQDTPIISGADDEKNENPDATVESEEPTEVPPPVNEREEDKNDAPSVEPDEPNYSVSFDYATGAAPYFTTSTGTVIPPDAPTRRGYEFIGWFIGNVRWDFDNKIESDTLFTAHWQVVTYNITYHLFGAENSDSNVSSYTVEQLPLSFEDPVMSEANFCGWFCDELFKNEVTVYNEVGNLELYAKFSFESEGLVYEKDLTREAFVVTGYTGSDTDVLISDFHEGLPVIGLAEKAFSGKEITSVRIPNTLEYIGKDCFADCSALVFNVDNDMNYLGNSKNPYYALVSTSVKKEKLKTVTIHGDTRLIASNAFYSFSAITEISGGEKLAYIGSYAFYGCRSLEQVPFWSTVEQIGDKAFHSCVKLKSLRFDKLIAIGDEAFAYCFGLEFVALPKSLTRISSAAFRSCKALQALIVGEGAIAIENDAFDQCGALEFVCFQGSTLEAWSKMGISFFDIESIYLYYEKPPELRGQYWNYASDGTINTFVVE